MVHLAGHPRRQYFVAQKDRYTMIWRKTPHMNHTNGATALPVLSFELSALVVSHVKTLPTTRSTSAPFSNAL
jgi:hypothetical protein